MESKKISFTASQEVYDFIAEQGMSAEFGARNIQRYAEEKIASPLIDELLFGRLTNGGKVEVVVEKGGLKCHVVS